MSTHVDGAAPSMAPDPDDGEPRPDASAEAELGSEWVRAEMRRRMAANRSTRGRHARGGEVAPTPPEREGPAAADGARLRLRSRPDVAPPTPPIPPTPPTPQPPAVPQPPQPPASWIAGYASPAELPENYVPRHSVHTPGPAADPAAPISGRIPVVRPPADPGANGPGANDPGANDPGGNGVPTAVEPGGGPTGGRAVGGPSLPPTGLPVRRRRGGGPGLPLQAEGAATAGPWSRPVPIVPAAPTRRLGAPPEMLGGPEPIPSWGVPLAAPSGLPGSTRASGPDTGDDASTGEDVSTGGGVPTGDTAVGGDDAGSAPAAAVAVGADDDVEVTDPTGSMVGPAVDRAPVAEPGAAPSSGPAAAPATSATTPPATAPPATAPPVTAPPLTALPGSGAAEIVTGGLGAGTAVARARLRGMPPGPAVPGTTDDTAGSTRTDGGTAPPVGPVAAGPDGAGAASAGVEPEESTESTGEITGEITDLVTAPHPVVRASRTASGRLVTVPAQRTGEQARTVTPRPLTPRQMPVVGNAPPEPGSTRVRVVLSERKGIARAVRTIKEVQEGTPVGELLLRNLIRDQLKVTLRFALLTALVLGALPAVFAMLPEVSRFHVLGLRLPWVLLGVLMYPFLVGVAWRYTRVADGVEQSFADHVQD